MNNNTNICLEKIKKNVQKCMFLKTPKFGMQKKAHIFISGLPNLNSFYIVTRDTESNQLKQKTKNRFVFFLCFFFFFFTKTVFLTKNNDF